MIAAGAGLAAFGLLAYTLSRRAREGAGYSAASREEVAASILHQLLVAGGSTPESAIRDLRRNAGVAARVTRGIDVGSWAGSYALLSSAQQRSDLLETAVRLVSRRNVAVPLAQYNALLDLSFGLGFQTDALARLRERYPFEYVDHAKHARPREADRAGGATTFFVRDQGDRAEWLRVLEIEGEVNRPAIIAAYRRLAARYHPDKIADRSAEAQDRAAARFIEVTRAYEHLIASLRD